MERQIGERFTWEGKVIEVCEGIGGSRNDCAKCFFGKVYGVVCVRYSVSDIRGFCSSTARDDGRDVYFREVKEEDVYSGKPFERMGGLYRAVGEELKGSCTGCDFLIKGEGCQAKSSEIHSGKCVDKKAIFKKVEGEMNEMTREDYLKAHRSSGIEEGDVVKVLRKAKGNELAWQNSWVGQMDRCVGQLFTVVQDGGEDGFKLNTISILESDFYFPWFVLEITKKKNQYPVELDDLDLECVSRDDLRGALSEAINNDLFNGNKYLEDYGPLFNTGGSLIREMEEADLSEQEVETVLEIIRRTYKERGNNNE